MWVGPHERRLAHVNLYLIKTTEGLLASDRPGAAIDGHVAPQSAERAGKAGIREQRLKVSQLRNAIAQRLF